MRKILAAIAGLLVVGSYGVVQAQPTAQEKQDPNTKVYAYKKAAPQAAAAERAKERERAAEPQFGTQEWWRITKDRYSSGDGGS